MQSKALSSLAVLVAVLGFAAAAYLFMDPDNYDPITDNTREAEVDEGGDNPAKSLQGARGDTDNPSTSKELTREEYGYKTPSAANSAQGVEGRILTPTGRPVPGATVFLIRGVGLDSFQLLLRYQKGERFPPISMATSNEDGHFRLGLKDWQDKKTYEVRIHHDDFSDHRIERIRPQPEDWWNVGDVKLKRGTTIYGTVYSGDGSALPGATVTARPQFTHGMLSVPGREEGLEVKTGESGNYEIRNINPLDFAGLSAHAPSHTRVEKTELQLAENSRVHIDFQLDEGFEISGVVVDPQGNPIRGARITCAALSQKSPQEQKTYTNAEGVFVAEGLLGGMFNVIVEADGHQRAEEKPVEAGTLDLKITIEKLGSVYVTAYGRNRRPLDRFLCSIKPALAGQTTYGKPMLTKEATAPKNGTELITGLIPLTYVAEVSARGYAKNFSPKFTIIEGQTDPVSVEVQLNQGGTLRGVVNDASGKPVQGVSVSTMPHDLIENPLITAFGGAPYTITRSTVKTNKKGIYEFKLLHPGDYQLKFMHPDFCTAFTKKNIAEVDQERDLPPVALERGCEVSGIAQLNGKPTGQVKVHISAEQEEGTLSTFNAEATTDNEGRFLIPKRLPAGKYIYRAAQMGLGPFMIMVQYQKTTAIEIQPSEEQRQLLVTVPVINK